MIFKEEDLKDFKIVNDHVVIKKVELKAAVNLPSTDITSRRHEFGEVINADNKELIGKLVIYNAFTQSPIVIGSTNYIECSESTLIGVYKGDKLWK